MGHQRHQMVDLRVVQQLRHGATDNGADVVEIDRRDDADDRQVEQRFDILDGANGCIEALDEQCHDDAEKQADHGGDQAPAAAPGLGDRGGVDGALDDLHLLRLGNIGKRCLLELGPYLGVDLDVERHFRPQAIQLGVVRRHGEKPFAQAISLRFEILRRADERFA